MPIDWVETPVRGLPADVPWWSLPAGLLPLAALVLLLIVCFWLTRLRRSCSAGSSETMSPDIQSTHFPHRPIRPLPKRRLRERLSPGVADSIQYPPAPASTTPLFLYAYTTRDDEPEPVLVVGRDRGASDLHGRHLSRGADSDEDEPGLRRAVDSWSGGAGGRSVRPVRPDASRHTGAQPAHSTTSSVDGYDSLENTNNKKKRKIPTAGDVSLNGVHSLGDTTPGGVSLVVAPSPTRDVHGE